MKNNDGAQTRVWAASVALAALGTLGPCCLVRYVYPVMLCVPALWGMLRTRVALQKEH